MNSGLESCRQCRYLQYRLNTLLHVYLNATAGYNDANDEAYYLPCLHLLLFLHLLVWHLHTPHFSLPPFRLTPPTLIAVVTKRFKSLTSLNLLTKQAASMSTDLKILSAVVSGADRVVKSGVHNICNNVTVAWEFWTLERWREASSVLNTHTHTGSHRQSLVTRNLYTPGQNYWQCLT